MNQSSTPSKDKPSVLNNGMLLMFASVAFFSASNILIKLAGDTLSAPTSLITTSRFLFGFMLAAFLFRGKERVSFVSLVTNPWLVSRGLVGGVGVHYFNECIVNMDVGRTTVITSAYPIFAILLAPVLVGESINLKQMGYCALAFLGLIAMTGAGLFTQGVVVWDVVAILVAIASGFVVVVIRKLHSSVNTATIFISQCAYGLLFTVPQSTGISESLGPHAIVVVLCSSVLVVLGQLAMTHGYKTLSVSKGSSVHLLMPVISTLASVFIFGEQLTPLFVLGAALILFACYRISTGKTK